MLMKWKQLLLKAREFKHEAERQRVSNGEANIPRADGDSVNRIPRNSILGRGGKILRGKREYKPPTNGVGKTGKQSTGGTTE